MLQNDIEQALLKARLDKAKAVPEAGTTTETLTLLKASLQNESIKLQKDLTDKDIIKVIKSNVKQLNQTLESAEKAQRDELIAKTKAQLELLSAYLPKTLSEDEILTEIEANSSFSKDLPFGKAMGLAMKHFAGKADGATVKLALQSYLR